VPAFAGGVSRREFLKAAACGVIAGPAFAQSPRTMLHNGIVLPSPWPPRRAQLSTTPQPPPYLVEPPPAINIDTGRQLFVDDFLIEESSLHREFHAASYHRANPVLAPQRDWEHRDPHAALTGDTPSPTAMPFSDGVFFDPADRLFKMWYMAGYQQQTALAISHDGVSWQRPAFDVVRGTNIVSTIGRDSNTVWFDPDGGEARFKMAGYDLGAKALRLQQSRDGVHWRPLGLTGPCGDRSTFFRDPFLARWVFSLRDDGEAMTRFRRYFECRDFATATWTAKEPVVWVGADAADRARPEMPTIPRQLYNVDAVAYESLLVGLFAIYRGESAQREKPIDLCVAFSRDGFHWSRDSREPFIPVSEHQGDWNWANVQSAGGVCLIAGDELYFYVSGRQGVPGTQLPGICSTGLATLRRDGFASVTDTWPANTPRQLRAIDGLLTRPLVFSGGRLFVNADVAGELRVEVLDRDRRVIEAFAAGRCRPIHGDATRMKVEWTGGADMARLAGQPVRFRFALDRGRLYSFWVSRSERGESGGYRAAGGPGLASPIDR
jgi:hypothetical protein